MIIGLSRLIAILCIAAVPPAGSPVAKGQLRRAGPYVLGPRLGTSPVRSIVQCLARQENTGESSPAITGSIQESFLFSGKFMNVYANKWVYIFRELLHPQDSNGA